MTKPIYPHDSDTSDFLGQYRSVEENVTFDLYYQSGKSWQETVIARFGPGGQYRSGMFAAHGMDPVLTEARRRAIKRALIRTSTECVQQGAVRFSFGKGAVLMGEGSNIIALLLDTDSKYVEIDEDGQDDQGVPTIALVAGEESISLDSSFARHLETIIKFPRFEGWSVFCAEVRGGYTIHVVLKKDE